MLALVVLVLLAASSGCVIGLPAHRVPRSHFVPPEAQVTAREPGEGTAIRSCGMFIFTWNGFTPQALTEAYAEAIAMGGGDVLIDATQKHTWIVFPALAAWCVTTVTGTAAKVEVPGK